MTASVLPSSPVLIPPATDLVSIALTLKPDRDLTLQPQYTTQLHGWFLHQIREIDPELSQQLHDGQEEKAFTISQLQGATLAGREIHLSHQRTYTWQITALSRSLCEILPQWISRLPSRLSFRAGSYQILDVAVCYPPTTYTKIWEQSRIDNIPLELTFTTPTSFRKRGNHLPLPIPENLFHSYLRRWNHFASQQFNQAEFLEWVNDNVVILRHVIHSVKVQAGKSGSVTGFVGSVQLGLTKSANRYPEYSQLFRALLRCAPYFNTGHKVTFGLGQTRLGWGVRDEEMGRWGDGEMADRSSFSSQSKESSYSRDYEKSTLVSGEMGGVDNSGNDPVNRLCESEIAEQMAARERELVPIFLSLKKRQGGERAMKTAQLWAQIIARLELGDSLKEIAIALEMPYDTVKKYAQSAKKQLEARPG